MQYNSLETLILHDKKDEVCLPDLAVLQSEDAVQEYEEANQSGRKQHPRVPAEPGEVQTNLLPKIPPDTAEHKSSKCEAFFDG